MPYKQPVDPKTIEVHVTVGATYAAAYQDGVLADSGDYDEVSERLLEALGVFIEHNSDPLIDGEDHRGRPRKVPAPTLAEITA